MVSKLVWRVKLVAELEPGVTTETEVACLERGEEAGLADPQRPVPDRARVLRPADRQ